LFLNIDVIPYRLTFLIWAAAYVRQGWNTISSMSIINSGRLIIIINLSYFKCRFYGMIWSTWFTVWSKRLLLFSFLKYLFVMFYFIWIVFNLLFLVLLIKFFQLLFFLIQRDILNLPNDTCSRRSKWILLLVIIKTIVFKFYYLIKITWSFIVYENFFSFFLNCKRIFNIF